MLLSQIEIGNKYILHAGLEADGKVLIPHHDLVVVITRKKSYGVAFRVLPDQFNPSGYSTEKSGLLGSEAAMKSLSEIEK